MGAALKRYLIGWIAVLTTFSCLPSTATAQSVSGVTKFFGGAGLAFAMHEAGHVVVELSVGVSPGIDSVRFGPIPFFAITHRPVSPAWEIAISSAGFWVQHASSEIILVRRPHLRDESAPLLKGMLAFNVVASVAYAGAAFARTGPLERDTRGIALSADIGEPLTGVFVLGPAVFDAVRYYRPKAVWAKWASRGAKIAGVLLIVKAV